MIKYVIKLFRKVFKRNESDGIPCCATFVNAQKRIPFKHYQQEGIPYNYTITSYEGKTYWEKVL